MHFCSVCKRFEGLATLLAFKSLYMDSVRVSRMLMLPYLLHRSPNPHFGSWCRSLHLRMGDWRRTRAWPYGPATTAHQDDAQAQVIGHLRLESISITLEYSRELEIRVIEPVTWTERTGFPRTLQAISRCSSIRHLCFNTNTHGPFKLTQMFLSGVLQMQSSTLERLQLRGSFVVGESTPEVFHGNAINPDDPISLPVLQNVTYLSIDHYESFHQLLKVLSKHYPALESLAYGGGIYQHTEPSLDPRDMIAMRPINHFLLKGGFIPVHAWRIPSRRIELELYALEYRRVLQRLLDAMTERVGVFSEPHRSLVQTITIKVARPSWSTKFHIPWTDAERIQWFIDRWPSEDPEEGLLASLDGACRQRGIHLSRQITDSPPSLEYITSYVGNYGSHFFSMLINPFLTLGMDALNLTTHVNGESN